MRRLSKSLVSFIAVFTGVSPFVADWNETHIYNPYWPPHAKFHNGQTMMFGVLLAVFSLYLIWRKKGDQTFQFMTGVFVAALYWLAQAPAFLFPGADFTDPQLQGANVHTIFGLPGQQGIQIIIALILVFAVVLYRKSLTIRSA